MSPEILPPEIDIARVVRTVLVADVVESVRLMQEDEAGTVQRWRAFVDHVVHRLLPGQDGRLVKSLGDGLMLEFPLVSTAVTVAFAMQDAIASVNPTLTPERRLHLRIGIHISPVVADEHDIYGHGVNLAARLMTLAGPDEIVVSADVRDQLTPALDADIEDLGECYVKHVQQPVRAFRVGAPGEQPVIERGNLAEDLRATIAVIPFRQRALRPTDDVLGQLLADEVISALSRSPEVNVISRLSTTAFQGREVKLDDVSAYLRADYVMSGSYHVDGDRVTLKAELAETRTMQVAWTKTLKGSAQGIVTGDDPLPSDLVTEACAAMMVRELQRARPEGQDRADQEDGRRATHSRNCCDDRVDCQSVSIHLRGDGSSSSRNERRRIGSRTSRLSQDGLFPVPCSHLRTSRVTLCPPCFPNSAIGLTGSAATA